MIYETLPRPSSRSLKPRMTNGLLATLSTNLFATRQTHRQRSVMFVVMKLVSTWLCQEPGDGLSIQTVLAGTVATRQIWRGTMPNLETRRCCECGEPTLFASEGETINAACRQCVDKDPLLRVIDQRAEGFDEQ